MAVYVHDTLRSPRSIRLLRLWRSDFDLDTPAITGELVETSLDSCPKYNAISYTWGDPTPIVPIQCSNKTLLVTQSCAEALRRLMRASFSQVVWIDGICINQKSIRERNQQVTLMGEIYRRAKKVLVWLGPATQGSDMAIDCLKKLLYSNLTGSFAREVSNLHAFDLNNVARFPFGLLGEIFTRPWFRRMWVIQEIAMSTGRVVFYCGAQFMTLSALYVAVDQRRAGRITAVECHWFSHVAFLMLLRDLIAQRDRNEQPRRSFQSIFLSMAALRESTDPKDKIFAYYGIAKHLGWGAVEPDYELPTSKVYTDAVRAVITSEQSFDILNTAAGRRAQSDLPTWVTDFSQMPRIIFKPSEYFKASGQSRPICAWSQGGQEMTVKGVVVDLIDTCAAHLPWTGQNTMYADTPAPSGVLHDAIDILQAWSLWSQEVQLQNSTEPVEHIFARTIFMDIYGSRDSSRVIQAYTQVLSPLLQRHMGHVGTYNQTIVPADEVHRTLTEAIMTNSGRAIASTCNGRMASVPETTRNFDSIVIFAGSKVPCILRPVDGGRFIFIGSAYVHGIMDGESWTNNLILEDFVLI